MPITVLTLSPPVQAVFDALQAVLEIDPTYVNVNSYATQDATGTTSGITITDKFGSNAAYSTRITTGKVFLEPMSASLGPAETLQFAATTLDDTGAQVPATVTWSVQTGALGTISATGLYTAPASIAMQGFDYVTARDAAGASATASVTLHL